MDNQQPQTHLTPDPVPPSHEISPHVPATGGEKKSFLSALTVDLTPLKRSREFRLFFTGQTVSFFGTTMTWVVLPVQMYNLTKSPLAVGLISIAEVVPIFLTAFVGGALADYIDRRRMVLVTEMLLAVGSIVLIWNSLLSAPKVWVLFVCAALFAALNGLQRPSLEALMPRLVSPELLPAAVSLNSLNRTTAAVGGPAVGGFIAALLGPAAAYSIDLVTFLVSLVALWMMRAVPPPADADRPSLRSIMEGLRYAKKRPELMGTYLVDINAMFFGMPTALFPAVAAALRQDKWVGLFYSASFVGAMLATLFSGWTSRVYKHGLAVTLAAAMWGVAIIGFGLANSLWLALSCLVIAGAADMISGLFRMIIWNQTIPDHLRGRLAGIEMISYTTGPLLGNAEAGVVASLFSLRTSIVSGGILCVLGTGVLALLLPSFVRYDGREGLKHKQEEEAARLKEVMSAEG